MKSLRHNRDGFGVTLVVFAVAILLVMVITSIAVSKQQPKSSFSKEPTVLTDRDSTPKTALAIIEHSGGNCSGNGCILRQTIDSDGTFEGHSSLSSAEVTKLRSLIDESDFPQYQKAAIDKCPSNHDGYDEILYFPEKYPGKSFKLCELDIPENETTVSYIHSLDRLHD